ncbi:hypothetical protein CDCA_CDCA01G0036 [Cyanidium caldarium]|uniref:AMP-dependent synthetase/ligase domain-containing protein n=1 Tax=Cyanidium caldarium TaxID=2771 RepID=A0AAV9IPJ9_CYACA|nr:hypothetical protein CDCA_CDCA01G0036 [Cyanidium caldarium]
MTTMQGSALSRWTSRALSYPLHRHLAQTATAAEAPARLVAQLEHVARHRPTKDALKFFESTRNHTMRFTARALWRSVQALAAGLRGELGLAPRDRLAAWLPAGSAESVVTCLAAAAAGIELVVLPAPQRHRLVDDVVLDHALHLLDEYKPRGIICWHEYETVPRAVAARVQALSVPAVAADSGNTITEVEHLDRPMSLLQALFVAPPGLGVRAPISRDSAGLAGLSVLSGVPYTPPSALLPRELEFVAHTGRETLRTLLHFRSLLVYDAMPHPCAADDLSGAACYGSFVFLRPRSDAATTADGGAGRGVHTETVTEGQLMREAEAMARELGGLDSDHSNAVRGRLVIAPGDSVVGQRRALTALVAALLHETLAIFPSYDVSPAAGQEVSDREGGALLVST